MRHARKQLHRNALRQFQTVQIFILASLSPLFQPSPLRRILLHKYPQRSRLPAAAKLHIHNFQVVRCRNPFRQRPNCIHLQRHKPKLIILSAAQNLCSSLLPSYLSHSAPEQSSWKNPRTCLCRCLFLHLFRSGGKGSAGHSPAKSAGPALEQQKVGFRPLISSANCRCVHGHNSNDGTNSLYSQYANTTRNSIPAQTVADAPWALSF